MWCLSKLRLRKIFPVLCWTIFCTIQASGQQSAVYNINKYNGLSSNHVYGTLVDRHGYLWLSTTDGVYRYNGYTMQRYDYNDGLANTDVWDMYEDRDGRIWLMSIANGIGYIQDNVYHPAVIKNDSISEKIYPHAFLENDSLILFTLKNTVEGAVLYAIVRNDTVELRKWDFDFLRQSFFIMHDKVVVASKESMMSYYSIDILLKGGKSNVPTKKIQPAINFATCYAGKASIHRIHKNIIYFSQAKADTASFFDFNANRVHNISSGDAQVTHIHDNKDGIFILTDYYAYHLSSKAEIVDTFYYHLLFNSNIKKQYSPTHFISNNFWGKNLSTKNEGLYINYIANNTFRQSSNALVDYRYVSPIDDSTAYWWNDRKNLLAQVVNGKIIASTNINDQITINHVLPVSDDRSLLIASPYLKWLNKNDQVTDFLDCDSLIFNDKIFTAANMFSGVYADFLNHINNGDVIDKNNFILLGTSFIGTVHVTTELNNKLIRINTIDPERYEGIAYYSRGEQFIIYNDNKILLYNASTRRKHIIKSKLLRALGLRRIEQIATDSLGNIFVKDYDKLIIFNPITGKTAYIFRNYNLQNSFISLHGNTLSIAGNFGVIQCNTTANGNVKNIHTFPNTKTLFYKYIYDVQFSKNSVLLNTDKGAYLVKTDSMSVPESALYKLIINNNSILYNINTTDTLHVDQATGVLGVDIIKPTGTGNLNISYSINGGTFDNTGSQMILPDLKPGTYNTVSLIASDDSWRSKPLKFTIYIQPEWWQTQTAKRIIFVLSLLAFIGFVYLIVVMTRRMVNRNNERRNQRRELELKSIYSQINPHFIFNSLSTAQYFVKKNRNKEAFDHINQFSDLLRAYIKSSRAKYISIAEEIENLENYLELQLTRFEEKFSYSIAVDPSVDPRKVKIPSLLLQPLVENALNHGIFHSETKGTLNISFKVDERDKDTLICIVDDNGVGRQRSKELRGKIIRKADSYGTILIKELIDTFNKYEKINIEIGYIDKQQPTSGTTVIVKIKNYVVS